MKIESVQKQANKKDCFAILFDDGTEIFAGTAQIADFGIYSGRELSEAEFDTLRYEIALEVSKKRALRMLGSRTLSVREVEKRLMQKGESQEIAHQSAKWLEDIGAINDEEYASSIVKHYSSKGYGIARIKSELYRRGIDREIWDAAQDGIEDTQAATNRILRKKIGNTGEKEELRRATAYLCGRGFTYTQAQEAVREYLNSQEEAKDIVE